MNYFLLKKENRDKKNKQREKYNGDRVVTATSEYLVILRDLDSVNLISNENMWITDSGATLHVIARNEFITTYTPSDGYLQTNIGMTLLLRESN